MSRLQLTFLGAAGTVTGSRYLIESDTSRVLVDCGLFQGYKQLRLRNWKPLPFDPRALDAVVLTHAHLDHSGYLPLLVKQGFSGPIYTSEATADLCGLLLPDSGHLQEEEADYANRHGTSKHHPAEPLYTDADAEGALGLVCAVEYRSPIDLGRGHTAAFWPAGHLLGAASVLVSAGEGGALSYGGTRRGGSLKAQCFTSPCPPCITTHRTPSQLFLYSSRFAVGK